MYTSYLGILLKQEFDLVSWMGLGFCVFYELPGDASTPGLQTFEEQGSTEQAHFHLRETVIL